MLNLASDYFDKKKAELVSKYITDESIKKGIFGINSYADSIADNIEVDFFVDDYRKEKEYRGKPLIKTEEIPKNSMLISVVVLGRNWTAMNKLIEKNIEAIDYFAFEKYSGLNIKKVNVFCECKEDIEENRIKYEEIYNKLGDEESKETFLNILNFRLSGNMEYLKRFKFRQEEQYFEEFLKFGTEEVFVDAGGFEGETALEFIKKCKNYKEIHIFEPDPSNLAKAKLNLEKYNNVYFYEKGVSNKKEVLKFGAGDGSASKISYQGNIIINVDSIDNMINEKITFVKMDIEGAEEEAIKGMKNHIINDCPKMAICCVTAEDSDVHVCLATLLPRIFLVPCISPFLISLRVGIFQQAR